MQEAVLSGREVDLLTIRPTRVTQQRLFWLKFTIWAVYLVTYSKEKYN